ncbi:MAG: DUF6175 family protein [Saprospiraceae bacterium]|nr:DUF6175 family protein [Saprospiraceae bacterium]MDP4698737.1 DUF6175 family protein [Saprospiraceae bacterium]MDP4809998.1 DUF6175 family protein [Saprospiraceae bacterium]MDP4814422.1 DUF6175 family protein [Saprospiraceae bacterium]MDP5046951.1 DUF6175 family protein [Saprospiraceae bacterium]
MTKLHCLAIILMMPFLSIGQAKKPTLMVVPSDLWCKEYGYLTEFNNQGTKVLIPDYKKALQEDANLILVISKINELMADRGFPLKNLESILKSLENQSAEDALLMNNEGAEINENPIDKLKKVAKADIIIQMTYTIQSIGPKNTVTFNLQGIDSYTNKQIAGSSGTGAPSFTAEIPVLLAEAVVANIDLYNVQLQNHFDDMFENGREVILRVLTWNNWEHNLESEDFGGDMLSNIIENWVHENTVKNRFSTLDATENMMVFEQVRIPLFNEKGQATDTRRWAFNLKKYLMDKFQIESKLMMKGLGQAQLILGDK